MTKKPLSDNVVIELWRKHNQNKKEAKRETIGPMQIYENETGKHAMWHGKITKQFQKWAEKKYGKAVY